MGHLDKGTQTVVLDWMRVWQGSKANPVHIGEVENELVGLSRRFHVRRIALDPWQLQSSIQRLRGRLPIKEFTFTAENVRRFSETLFNLVQTTRLRLYPDDALELELLSLNVVQRSYGRRIDHASGGYSDRATALGMMRVETLTSPGAPNVRFIDHGGDGWN